MAEVMNTLMTLCYQNDDSYWVSMVITMKLVCVYHQLSYSVDRLAQEFQVRLDQHWSPYLLSASCRQPTNWSSQHSLEYAVDSEASPRASISPVDSRTKPKIRKINLCSLFTHLDMTILEFLPRANQFLLQVFRAQTHPDNVYAQIPSPDYQFDHSWMKYDYVVASVSIEDVPDHHHFQLLNLYSSFRPQQSRPHLNVGFQFLKWKINRKTIIKIHQRKRS